MRIVLIGSPGAGKGTQALQLSQYLQIPLLTTGNMLRAMARDSSPLGMQLKRTMMAGELVADELMVELVKQRLGQTDCQAGYILDGFPRTLIQAQALAGIGVELNYVIEIQVAEEQIIARLGGRLVHPSSGRTYHILYNPPKVSQRDDLTGEPLQQRADDREEAIRNRLRIYHEQTTPLMEYYRNLANNSSNFRYLQVDGEGSVATVAQRIRNLLTQSTSR